MQKARYVDLFILTLAFLLSNWFVMNINAYPKELINSLTKSPPISPRLMNTKTTDNIPAHYGISYKLDKWSQYENPEDGTLEEGDILPLKWTGRRQVLREQLRLWPNGFIRYYVNSIITDEPKKLKVLEDALKEITTKTKQCITFERINDYEKLPEKNWVNITGHQRGCFSNVGRNPNGPNVLNLSVMDGCFFYIGHAIHEMLHTLGIKHEHSRPDRDGYITVIYENIIQGKKHYFDRLNDTYVTTFGTPYDYESVMHYAMTAYTKYPKIYPTIIPKIDVEIGQRQFLSLKDARKLQIAYNCAT